jgi:hypothetical protein
MKDLSVVTDQNLTAWLLVGRLTMAGVRCAAVADEPGNL